MRPRWKKKPPRAAPRRALYVWWQIRFPPVL
jgi:hypothetical protein